MSEKWNESKCFAFLQSLHFAIVTGLYWNVILKPKQVICLERLFLGLDVLAVLPTAYGKSLIYHLFPSLLFGKEMFAEGTRLSLPINELFSSVVIVVSPLNSLINDQIAKITKAGLRAAVLNVKYGDEVDTVDSDERVCDIEPSEKDKIIKAHYNLLFTHPESLLSSKFGREILNSKIYQKNVCAIVIDEAHCILEWGDDFRKDYSYLGMLCASFSNVPVLALTATANKNDRQHIKESLGLKKCIEVEANPDRKNIFYEKYFRQGRDADAITGICRPIANTLLQSGVSYPLTIIYLPLRWCGFVYRLFEHVIGDSQYYPPGCEPVPKNRLFAQFHAPQTKQMKDEILQQLNSKNSIIRVVFATVAFGMGVDIPTIRQIIHIGPPQTIREYFQETGRAGRDGCLSRAVLYYNNKDIASNKPGLHDEVRRYCQNEASCLRCFLLECLNVEKPENISPGHMCCSVCKKSCSCLDCKDVSKIK